MEASVATPTGTVQKTLSLTPHEAEILRQLAAERNLPEDVVLREALLEKGFFRDNRRNGYKVVFQHPDGKLSPVNWRY